MTEEPDLMDGYGALGGRWFISGTGAGSYIENVLSGAITGVPSLLVEAL